jgi:SRSO17 transposase
MTLQQIASLGSKLISFLALFSDCFVRSEGRNLLRVYVKGLLSDVKRKNIERIAKRFRTNVRTLQRFVESLKWDEQKLRDRCQQIVAQQHAHPEAIGCIDESGTTKSGDDTVGVGRQYNGNRGKVDNCVVGVHLSYSAPGFQVLLDSTVYLPKAWAEDVERRKKTTFPMRSRFAPNRKSR